MKPASSAGSNGDPSKAAEQAFEAALAGIHEPEIRDAMRNFVGSLNDSVASALRAVRAAVDDDPEAAAKLGAELRNGRS
jgi:hypothetical protein